MKKVMAIVIVLVLAVSLFACNKAPETTTSPSASVSPSSTPGSTTPGTSAGTSGVGFYDPNVDYSKNPNYKVGYIMSSTGVLYDQFSKSFKAWADRMNVTYNDFACNADNDLFVNTIQTYVDQGYNGLLLDPDSTVWPRVAELSNELNIPWMGCMSSAYDQDGKTLLHPSAGFDNYQAGVGMAQFNVDYAKKTWPDAKPEEFGAMFIGYSTTPQLVEREQGFTDTITKEMPEAMKNYYFGDGVTGQMDAQTGYNLASAILAAHPEVKYWLISGFFDDYTDGAARAVDAAGKNDTAVCSTFGGSSLIAHWDAGEDSAWKGAIFTDQRLFSMPIFAGLYAMMNGDATPEGLWPEWINHSRGDKYASIILPTVVITQDMYQSYLMWVDTYTGIHQNNYDVAPGTGYSPIADVPASYAG
ncbi:ABC-type sugar transport system, substrate-binding protein, contains N-terminal xre family HTH domain [Sporobacter termitidis DSM 10068]|uniref:ABC-type sugar transport system, substrate-binding protein, contains N-terminal xre family HTH domain n=1 Tax=Sporobacter termitidis DSM 10068 TaxID=1123282 RepID=A0A1M5WFW0_9FIRM|nr:substrate-binding domain-containing protein [Sporobacter termitidis]SHH86449.1 ABC-type sugar transport system, substrate-binding protein, contains N-terminal xre family HTH domain [Sporobacter termitidis DSM 10068]